VEQLDEAAWMWDRSDRAHDGCREMLMANGAYYLSSVARGADLGAGRYAAAGLSRLVDRANPALLAYDLHLPPSAVSLVSDYRFRRSAQRLARLTL
jgi:hypothetical protein